MIDLCPTAAEADLTARVFAMRPSGLLSFGTGQSLVDAAIAGIGRIVAVDCSHHRIDTLSAHPALSAMIRTDRASLVQADLGAVDARGFPLNHNAIQKWPGYIASAWQECEGRQLVPDLVHVRGRFRLACAISVGLMLEPDRVVEERSSPLVMLHGADELEAEAELTTFFDLVASADSLQLLRWRPDASLTAAFTILLKAQFDPR